MAVGKSTGMGITVFSIDDSGGSARAVLNDVLSFGIKTPRGLQDVTGLDKSAHERLTLLADGSVDMSYVFNDAATTGFFTVMKNFATIFAGQVGRTLTITFSGVVGAHTLAMELLFADVPWTRGTDGSLTGSCTGQLSDGTVPAWT